MSRGSQHIRGGAPWVQALAWIIIGLVIVVPLAVIVSGAFEHGPGAYFAALTSIEVLEALQLTALAVVIAVPLTTAFGLLAAWVLTKYRIPGRNIWLAVIDAPFAISPVVAGLMIVLVLGPESPLGGWLADRGFRVVFAPAGIVVATIFVTLPFVAREVVALMSTQGVDMELASLTLGASTWQTVRWVTIPNVRWAIFHGVVLSLARATGEFGAVSVVSGHIRGETVTMSLLVEMLHAEYKTQQAFAVATVLAAVAGVSVLAKKFIESKLSASRAIDATDEQRTET